MKDRKNGRDQQPDPIYAGAYSEKSLWEKVAEFALKAGMEIIEKVLILYFCLQDSDTPAWAKVQIVGALGYFIVPMDAIPDVMPVVGFADDLGVLVLALAAVAVHVKDEHKEQAAEKLKIWFGLRSAPED